MSKTHHEPTFSGTRKSKLEILERNDQLMELILDISNELDIDVLCHKGHSTVDEHGPLE